MTASQTIVKVVGARNRNLTVPSGWRLVRLSEVADARLGKMLDAQKNKGSLRPYVRNPNVKWFNVDLNDLYEMPFEDDELEKFSIKNGDVLVCEGGEAGRSAIWQGPDRGIKFQKAIHRVRCGPDLYNHFFVHRLMYDYFSGALADYYTGTTIKHFTGQDLARYLFAVPPPDEQRRIAAILDQADALRRKRRETLALLEKLPHAIFSKTFGDPTAISDEMEVSRISDIAELINGDRSSNYPSGDDIVTEGVLFLSTKNILGAQIDLTEANFISEQKFASLSRGKLQRNDLVITLRGTLGQCAIFDCEYDTGFINAQMMIIRPKHRVSPIFLRELIAHPKMQTRLEGNSSGSAVPQLTARQIGDLVIPIPPIELQKRFAFEMTQCAAQLCSAKKHLVNLHALFASLQHRAFRGEL